MEDRSGDMGEGGRTLQGAVREVWRKAERERERERDGARLF